MVAIQVSKLDSVTLMEVSGRIDSMTANELGDALTQAIAGGGTRLVLDLSSVEYMSSAGLRELVSAYKKTQREAGDLRLAQPSHRVQEILEMAGLDSVFQIFPNRTEAVSSY